MTMSGKQYEKYLKKTGNKKLQFKNLGKHKTKALKKNKIVTNYGRHKNIPLNDREAQGGGIFNNYRTKY